MLIECPYCSAKVDAKVIASHIEPATADEDHYRVSFVACSACAHSLVAVQEEFPFPKDPTEPEWFAPDRVWPSPMKDYSDQVPPVVGNPLREANICLRHGAYNACTVMCGRALEGICTHFLEKSDGLVSGIKELHKKGIIDNRLLAWADALRILRNIGAHAGEADVTKEEAKDVMLFTEAICEYVFTLSARFEEFQKRQQQKKERQKASPVKADDTELDIA